MLQITRQTEYAVRGLRELARRQADCPVQLKSIAKSCDISAAYLAKIFQMLSQNSIVKSHRGVKGGFTLGRNSDEITIRDIVEVCEGGIALNHCLRNVDPCESLEDCEVFQVWRNAQDALNTALEQTVLSDIL